MLLEGVAIGLFVLAALAELVTIVLVVNVARALALDEEFKS